MKKKTFACAIIIALSCITAKSQVLEFNLSNSDIPELFTISIDSYSKTDDSEGKWELNIKLGLRLNEPASINKKVKILRFNANVYKLLKSTVLYDSNQIEIKDAPIGFKVENFPNSVSLKRKKGENIEVTYPVILIVPKTVDFKYVKWFDFPVLELK